MLSNYHRIFFSILKMVWVEGCLGRWGVITSLISVCFRSSNWLNPSIALSLSAMLLVSRVFLNSPMWLLMRQPQSEALPLLTVRVVKLIASIHASHSPSYPALTTPPPPLCTGRKQNNRMTHRWRGVTCAVALRRNRMNSMRGWWG